MLRILTALLLFTTFSFAQKDSIVVQTFYGKIKTKSIIIYKGIDTVLVLKYYKGGQIKDSAHVTLKNDKEFYFGTQKSFYKTGKLSSVTYYKNGYDEFIKYSYREDGQLLSEIKKPGERKTYNKKGEITRQLDMNHNGQVFVPKAFRNQNTSLDKTFIGKNVAERKNIISRIKFKKACLSDEKTTLKINTGALISIILNSDTTVMAHCQIEGYSSDSIYLSKFDYNSNIKKDALQYENSFALAFTQIKTISYSKNHTRKKYNRANAATLIGFDLIIVPIALTPIAAASFGLLAPVFGACVVVGIPIYFLGKYLYKKMIPKKYDMNRWKIKIKT